METSNFRYTLLHIRCLDKYLKEIEKETVEWLQDSQQNESTYKIFQTAAKRM